MRTHRHRFHRLSLGRVPLTRWVCQCGLKVSTDIARQLEGQDLR